MVLINPWVIKLSESASKDFAKLDKAVQRRVLEFFEERLISSQNPRALGKALTGQLRGYWSYRVGDYRILADIRDTELVVLVIHIDHRRKIYE